MGRFVGWYFGGLKKGEQKVEKRVRGGMLNNLEQILESFRAVGLSDWIKGHDGFDVRAVVHIQDARAVYVRKGGVPNHADSYSINEF
jgi:hypothetical protein